MINFNSYFYWLLLLIANIYITDCHLCAVKPLLIVLYLLIYCIFSDVHKSGCASLDDRMIVYNEAGSGCSQIGETVMAFAFKE